MGYLDIVFTEKDEIDLNKCVEEFNSLCEMGLYPKLLEFTHYELSTKSSLPNPNLWKRFLLNPKIKEWYTTEKQILLNSTVQQLIRSAGSSNSTATVQTLNTLLAQQRAMEEQGYQAPVIIYNFIPITEQERKSGRINEVNNIPSGIERAIRKVERNTTSSKER